MALWLLDYCAPIKAASQDFYLRIGRQMTCRSGAELLPVVLLPQRRPAAVYEMLTIRTRHSTGSVHGVIQIPRPNVNPIAAMAMEKTGTVHQ